MAVLPPSNKICFSTGSTNPTRQQTQTDYISLLPRDVSRIIFSQAKTNLPALALVCRDWKEIADDPLLYTMIFPAIARGEDAWKQIFPVDPGKAPRLPRRVHKDIENQGGLLNFGLLTFIPKMINKDGVVVEELAATNMGELVKAPKEGNKTCYTEYSWAKAINEKKTSEEPHWVWIKINRAVCEGASGEVQQAFVGLQGGSVSEFLDTIVSLFMDYIMTGRRCFALDSDNGNTTIIQVKDKTDEKQIRVGFVGTHLNVSTYFFAHNAGALVARKFFGT